MDDQAGGDDWESVPVKGKKGKGGVKSADKKAAGILHNLPIAPGMCLPPLVIPLSTTLDLSSIPQQNELSRCTHK